ncbi:unnamed protein product [Ilex paraguariensis]|uniref:Uncharacterized protein n=1 Tax=Ilex paraguariensis TaxID=185542 RepID=A0ABC8QT13_9AQUA
MTSTKLDVTVVAKKNEETIDIIMLGMLAWMENFLVEIRVLLGGHYGICFEAMEASFSGCLNHLSGNKNNNVKKLQ